MNYQVLNQQAIMGANQANAMNPQKPVTPQETMEQYADRNRPQLTQGYDPKNMSQQSYNYAPSRWLSMTKMGNALDMQTQKENALRMSKGQIAGAQDALAAKGGLSSGATERLQEAGMKNYLGMAQDLTRQNNSQNYNLSAQDMQSQQKAQALDTQNQIGQIDKMNQFNQNVYSEKMSAEAASRQADAEASAGREAARARKRGVIGAFK